MNRITLIFAFIAVCLQGFSQKNEPSLPDILESSLASIVTVAVYKTDYASVSVGRGSASAISEEAYKKALDMGVHESSGSGFMVDINGRKYIITNYHVISDVSSEPGSLKAFSINRTSYEMKVVGGDPLYDIAVLQFVDAPGKELTTTKFRTDESRIGERVFAVGNPLGEFPYSVSDGIVSARNRVRGGLTGKYGYIQHTATVIWGNSGGPIVDEKGRVLGINSYIQFAEAPYGGQLWQSQINYALEARLADRLSREIVANGGRITRAYLGIECSVKSSWSDDGDENALIQRTNIAPVITGVLRDSPASIPLRSKYGYSIVQVNGADIRNLEELLGAFESLKPNTEVKLLIRKDSAEAESVTIRTTELGNAHLEDIALHVLKKEKSISLIENVPYVGINYTPTRFRMLNDQLNAVLPYDNQSQWQVVAAGRDNDEYNLYKVESLKDVGAAIRLASLSGAIDFKMIPPGADLSAMSTFRFTLSDEAYMIQSILYY